MFYQISQNVLPVLGECSIKSRKMFYHNIEESHLLIYNAKIANLYFAQKDRKHDYFFSQIQLKMLLNREI